MYSLIIVDDEISIREGIINLFPWNQVGFEIIGNFPNGLHALSYLEKHTVDVVLTDIEMPGMSGTTLSDELVRLYPKTRIVFLTGYQNYEYMHKAILNHAFDYLLKPIKYEELYTCFENIRQMLDTETNKIEEIPPQGYYEKIVSTVLQYIEENFKNATLEGAANLVNLSPNYLSKVMKERSAYTFSDYLYETRMKQAGKMLKSIEYKHFEIAYHIGYDNPKNFSRAFKQYYNMTPRQYREGFSC